MRKLSLLLILFSGLLAVSCKDDGPGEPEPPTTSTVLIANEGIFPAGIGTLSSFNPNTGEVNNNIFQKANSYPLGPVVQSLLVEGDRTWVVVNGSGVVYVVNTNTMVVEAKFENLQSPRQVVKVREDKYYISDWGINGLHVVNMNSMKITDTIGTGYGPENMLTHDTLVFVVNSGGLDNSGQPADDNTVFVIHAEADTVLDVLQVGDNPNSLAMDMNGYIWVLSPGIIDFDDPSLSTVGSLHRINVDSIEVDTALFFADNQLKPANLVADKEGRILYFLENDFKGGIMMFEVNLMMLPMIPYINGGFHTLGYDPINQELYGGNANDYTSAGTVQRFSLDGQKLNTFNVGIIPTDFGFK